MARRLSLLFGLTGTVSRQAYLATGAALGALKYALDSGLAYSASKAIWDPRSYLEAVLLYSAPELARLTPVSVGPMAWLGWLPLALLVTSLPFVWVAIAMTMRRSRDAGFTPWLAALLLFPIVGPALIVFLSFAPPSAPALVARPRPSRLGRAWGGAALGTLAGLGLGLFAAHTGGGYGAGLFVATPTFMGIIGGYAFNRDRKRSLSANLGLAIAMLLLTALAVVAVAIEGVVCVVMAFPLALLACFAGTLGGRSLANPPAGVHPGLAAMLTLPLALSLEARHPQTSQEREVVTYVDIAAPREAVWNQVLAFPDLPAPTELIFHSGIAYPVRATIDGQGIGAIRRCEFSTGAFVEPITAWDENRRLAFDVVASPDPIVELSPFHIRPPHLDGYFRSRRGEFRLEAQPDGGTRLFGSTWYQLDIAPRPYWQLWADPLLHRIHRRVLDHIKRLAESAPR